MSNRLRNCKSKKRSSTPLFYAMPTDSIKGIRNPPGHRYLLLHSPAGCEEQALPQRRQYPRGLTQYSFPCRRYSDNRSQGRRRRGKDLRTVPYKFCILGIHSAFKTSFSVKRFRRIIPQSHQMENGFTRAGKLCYTGNRNDEKCPAGGSC